MTSDTTSGDAWLKRRGGRGSRRFWLIVLAGSVVFHVGLLAVLEVAGVTAMVFDREAAVLEAEEVREREAERREWERERRERLRLTEEQARDLQEEVERAERREAMERLRELEQTRRELEARRDQMLREVERRRVEEVTRPELPEVQEALRVMRARVARLADREQTSDEDQARLREAMEATTRSAEALADRPAEAVAVATELADRVEALAEAVEASRSASEAAADEAGVSAAESAMEPVQDLAAAMDGLLGKVGDMESFNDTSMASSVEPRSDAPDASALEATGQPGEAPERSVSASGSGSESAEGSTLAEAYEAARRAEADAREVYSDLKAAEIALRSNRSFAEAKAAVGEPTTPDRPDLSDRLSDTPVGTVGELNAYRQAVDTATRQIGDMSDRTTALLAQANGQPGAEASRVLRSLGIGGADSGDGGPSRESLNLSGTTTGGGFTEGLDQGTGGTLRSPGDTARDAITGIDMRIIREALPGRMFTRLSDRRGWLYLDTWYFIGPWHNEGEPDFNRVLPPEVEVNLDATYPDGKFAGRAEHPDAELRWTFMQSDEVRIQPPRSYGQATYFAYTEVYLDEAMDVLVAFGADAAGRIWVNDELVWEDDVRSVWRVVEGYKVVRFRAGYNRVLVRLMNGSGTTAFSALLCPADAAPAARR